MLAKDFPDVGFHIRLRCALRGFQQVVKDLDLIWVHLKLSSTLQFEVRIHLDAKLFIALFVVNANRYRACRFGRPRKESSRIKSRRCECS
jgi:hypothetical protein